MIFASLGTMNIAFNRMAKAVDEWAAITKEEVIVQTGYTDYPYKHAKAFKFCTKEQMKGYISRADILILRAVRGGGRVGKPLGFSPGSHLPQPGTPGRRFLRGGVLQGRDTLLPSREEVLGRYPLLRPLRVCRPGLRCGARGAPALRLRGLLPGVGMTAQVFTN